ncbi:hypothetical protein [Mogibacterium diversum]|uniref:hypothetical protein n=1 Tax=Mogibacterium diversum TaxID=114527 RepID=UPI001FE57C37|nr:hypothetical protein [Mogibacterium diversum]DAQ10121.1 MAG TPA: hypothetical protein [Caudoviricetes sp.]DAS15006.1 MAG TPA: hypothetical protein [Caudoviricetes sp.]
MLDWTSIVVACVSALGAGGGSLYGIRKSSCLTDYKIDKLTEEVRKHNDFASRIPVIEEKLRVINHRIDDLEKNK